VENADEVRAMMRLNSLKKTYKAAKELGGHFGGVFPMNKSEIVRRSGLTPPTVYKAIRILEEYEILKKVKGDFYTVQESEVMNWSLFDKPISWETMKKAMEIIASKQPCKLKDIPLPNATLRHYLRHLEEAGIIQRMKAGRRVYVFTKDKEKFMKLCDFLKAKYDRIVTVEEMRELKVKITE